MKPKTGIIITANSPFAETQRLVIANVYLIQNTYVTTCMYITHVQLAKMSSTHITIYIILYIYMYICNICNMGMRDLPDMYTHSPRAKGIHIRQIPRAHVTSNMYHFRALLMRG